MNLSYNNPDNMASTLPAEILLQILAEVDYFPNKLKLLGVCRHWNTVLCGTVYSRIDFWSPELWIPLAATLIHSPRLRPLINRIHLTNSYGSESRESGFYDPDVFREFIQLFMDSDDEEKQWEERLDVNGEYAWLALILLLVPNLQDLNMRWATQRYDQTVLWIVDKMAARSPEEGLPLQNLRRMSARSGDIHQNFHIDRFIPFLKLPSLRTLRLADMHDDNSKQSRPSYFDQYLGLGLKPGRLEVRELSFQGSNFQHGLSDLLPACIRLEHFEYQHCNQVQWGDTYRSFRCRAFREGLLSQRDCLRVLRLNDVGVSRFLDEIDEEDEEFLQEKRVLKEQAWFGSLADFEALERLRIPVCNILDSTDGKEPSMALDQVLPPSLEILVLAKVDYIEYSMLEGQLKQLLQCKATRFPKLQQILLQPFQLEVIGGEFQRAQGNWGVPELAKTVFADVANSCQLQGIEFGFTEYGDFVVMADGEVVDDTDDYAGRPISSRD